MKLVTNTIMFKSNEHREAEMRRLQELERQREFERQRQRELQRQRDEQNLIERINSYPSLDNPMSTAMAGFLSQFTCAIQNASEHNIMEFFGDEETAAELRKDLSPECQADSKMLREEIQKLDEVKDPVMALICANRMEKFAPKEGIMTEEQYDAFLDGIKKTVSVMVRSADLKKYEDEDRISILEMIQQIERAETIKFGIGDMLKKLVDKLNSAKFEPNFIPPVTVKPLQAKDAIKILK